MAHIRGELLGSVVDELFDFLTEAVIIAEHPSGAVLEMNLSASELCAAKEGQQPLLTDLFEAVGDISLEEVLKGNPWKMDLPCEFKGGEYAGRQVLLSWQLLSIGGDKAKRSVVLVKAMTPAGSEDNDGCFRIVSDDLVTLMASSLSHDLNNIIGVMSGSISTIKRAPLDGARAIERFELLEKSVARAVKINRELMGYARRGAEGKESARLDESLREAVREAREVLPPEVDVKLSVSNDLPEVQVNKLAVKGVLLSLLLNSWQAMKEGGVISVAVESCQDRSGIECSRDLVLPEGDYTRVTVSDNGPGIPHGIRGKIFDPFFSTESRGEGAGLGLTAVERIMRSLGGGVRLGSTKKGACFELFLPTER